MDTSALRVAIYTRISQDRTGAELGVERQLEDCQALAKANGWTVVAEYSDNDISAYGGKRRPGYAALLDAIKNRDVDVVVAWHTDRLHRRLRDLVEYTDVVTDDRDRMVVATHTVKAGDIDLSTPSGIMIAHIKGAVDEAYVSEAREKNKRGRLQIAQKGGRHKSARVYGWEDDGIKLRESEAVVVREIVARLTEGEAPTRIAADLNRRDIPTLNGKEWTGIGTRKAGERASNAAIRQHLDEQYDGNWQPIITRDEHSAVLAALKARQGMAFKRGAGRRYLLTGFAFCGSCGNKLGVGKARSNSSSAYRCDTRGSHTFTVKGCGRISRNVAPLEALIEEYVLYRLDSDALLEAVNRAQDDRGEVKELIELQRTQQQKINDLVDEYATTTLWSKAEFARAKSAANTNLASINKKLSAISYRHTLTNIDLSKSLHETWQTATLEWKRGIIELLIDKVLVYPYPVRGYKLKYFRQWRFNVELIEVIWRA